MNVAQIDALETPADFAGFFGLGARRLDPIASRLASWAETWTNARRIDGVFYSWDTNPRVQQNGAVVGRVYAQPYGEAPRDIGAFKIDREGNVLLLPAELRGKLPGTTSDEDVVGDEAEAARAEAIDDFNLGETS